MASSLHGRYWITHEGPISICGREHAQIVKVKMLELEPDEIPVFALIKNVYRPISEHEARIHRKRGIEEKLIQHLVTGLDPRIWALREWSWIRTCDSQFNCWMFNDAALALVRSEKNTAYWKIQERCLDALTDIWFCEESASIVMKHKALDVLNFERDLESLRQCMAVSERTDNFPRTGRFFRA